MVGAVLGSAIPDPGRYGLDLVFPLAFLGLLMAFLKGRVGLAVALGAGGLALVGAYLLPGKWYVIVAGLLGIVLGVAGQLGDLTMSLFKRGAGVKDSSSILPGRAGLLDVLDSLPLAGPLAWWLLVMLV